MSTTSSPGCDAGNFRNIEDSLVHADAADERGALAADEQAEAVAEAAVEAVGVAEAKSARRMGSVATKVPL